MQHDTSPFKVLIGSEWLRLQASLLYLRYSKRRYLQFYPVFDRFHMKCFLHLALMHWGYAPRICVIDNTNLARWRGLGSNAVMVPEMEAFGKAYGFRFLCHAPKHPDRKAGEERSFLTVETNFIPGRPFQSLEDLNRQALEWSTVRMEQRPQGKAGLIPAQAFEHERAFLTQLPRHLPAPYLLAGANGRRIRLRCRRRELLRSARQRPGKIQVLRYLHHRGALPGSPHPHRICPAALGREEPALSRARPESRVIALATASSPARRRRSACVPLIRSSAPMSTSSSAPRACFVTSSCAGYGHSINGGARRCSCAPLNELTVIASPAWRLSSASRCCTWTTPRCLIPSSIPIWKNAPPIKRAL